MRPVEIEALPAGPEMDALVAEKVMGWAPLDPETTECLAGVHKRDKGCAYEYTHPVTRQGCPRYSTSDAAALEVLKKLVERFEEVDLNFRRWTEDQVDMEPTLQVGQEWYCGAEDHDMKSGIFYASGAPTLALAICRAALKAVTR